MKMSLSGVVWQVVPEDHAVGKMDFDVVVGGDGRRSSLPGFDRKEFRGKLALAITANFVNYFTQEESAVEEISGVARIFNQKFFKELNEELKIDLENIVYYRNETHYFVMTAKKKSLLNKGVLKEVGGVLKEVGGMLKDVSGVLKEISGVLKEVGGVLKDVSGVLKEVSG